MAMRRGQHTSRVLKALGTRTAELNPHDFPVLDHDIDPDALPEDETLPNAFDE
jgi:acetolactate synthase-1/3 small subunit